MEMEENMNTEIMEVEETTFTNEDEDNSGNAGAMLVILGIGAVGALIGVGAMKIGSKVKQKIQAHRESEKVTEIIGTVELIDTETKEPPVEISAKDEKVEA
jgi:hypothetical protein